MSRGLAEQIAVLDGLNGNVINAYDQINASNGANYSGGSSYPENNGIPLMTSSIGLAGTDNDLLFAYDQINASNGGNYSGGSNYPEENPIPLMTSSVGLAGTMKGFADADLLAYANGVGQIPNTLPARMNVLDASGGANYSGGSSYAPGLPLLPSSAGLAAWGWNMSKIRRHPKQMHNLKILQSLPPLARAKVLRISRAILRAKRANDPASVTKLSALRKRTVKQFNPAAIDPWR